MSDDIRTISRDELQAKLDAGDDVKLVMTLHEWAFRAARIPGSLHFATVDEAYAGSTSTTVVYCSDPACVASQYAYHAQVDRGYRNVRRYYAGGLADWTAAGLPLDSDRTDPPTRRRRGDVDTDIGRRRASRREHRARGRRRGQRAGSASAGIICSSR
ncbi:MAG TPA: rhodanese-like domain-containing protein [Euzebyales bacterium]|nr:rhodanese-like domain-containing protein [Euzebyales bacterium]